MSSPKNDSSDQVRTRLWFPVVVNAKTKFADWSHVQVRGHAEALSAALSDPTDGWIILEQPVMNRDAERVTLLSVERKRLVGIKEVNGERVRYEKDVVRLRLKGVDEANRFYILDMPANSRDHKIQNIIAAWDQRMAVREKYADVSELTRIYEHIDPDKAEKIARDVDSVNRDKWKKWREL